MEQPKKRITAMCTAYGVDGAVRGGMIGLMWGLFQGTYYGWQDQLRGRLLGMHVARNLAANTVGFAAFLGIYQIAHCSMENSRKRSDWKNAAAAGLVTGGVMGLPLAVRTGEPRWALFAAGFTAALTGSLDLARPR
ncbi:hypothetical protein GUITHDRAFT_150332 [Guillardia theta CCMP2712]|uniref:Mitochondrial import inner membrane translocase subunit TIM22 n=1 Tax=Guillardia theta (strain CCMP2712) TaxID=905079 RepID=L1JXR6_GUITC|nr:hypothetical protein GUITHDRAFT_150332 [Guillardia theta CCMP2712]EKX53157.1 hypothetical protein GUITHDRAFT_150332 [Guillardia theta CCMP2712]|mmetsp:Transcript_50065/g.156691  ORF Transcript_50065/g.156691 Transcript_50065/m.156691 type:complete len:136 (+) Transcript_50065:207-614(+)|eukprot:XP_005840137.1 hypothetical protein GUITHDRAFT_150332 [Guillardia theta CCMP2712]